MKSFVFNAALKAPKKRFVFVFEKLLVNGKFFCVYTIKGTLSEQAGSFFYPVYHSRQAVFQDLAQVLAVQKAANDISVEMLRLVGTGYKSIVPKKFSFKFLYLRVGFAASELLYALKSPLVKMRARKQKILLFGFKKSLLSRYAVQICNLRYPKCLYW
jgi:hypothetical protein